VPEQPEADGYALSLYVDDNDGYIPRRGQVQKAHQISRMSDWFTACCLCGSEPYWQLVRGRRPRRGPHVSSAPRPRPGWVYFLRMG